MAGRLQLIKSVILSMFVYTFQVYKWPVSLLRRIEVWCRNFLWSGSIDKRGIPLVAWKSCCSSIEEGGLGLKQLVLLNRSLLLKRCWQIFSSSSEGCSFIRNRFSKRRSYAPSSVWPGVRSFWGVIQDNSQWFIGSGAKISFWTDNFLGRPIIDLFGDHVALRQSTDLISNYIDNGLLHLHFPALCNLISQVPVAKNSSMEDNLIWTPSSSGDLTAKQAYLFLRHPSSTSEWGKRLWSKFIWPRMSLHTWKVLRGRVISDDFLQRRGVALVSQCNLCGASTESLDHIFLHCSFSAAIWSHFSSIFELAVLPPSILGVFLMGLHNGRIAQLKELWLICFTSVLWFIWHARNKIRFDGRTFSIAAVCRLISGHIRVASRLASGPMNNTI